MKSFIYPNLLTLALVCALAPALHAEAPSCGCELHGAALDTSCETCATSGCHHAGHKCHKHCNKKSIAGLAHGFHCGHGGSYNYPVPPLYTYHWPGMYAQKRMTDYHSPWRFPPIKPYTDEYGIAEVTLDDAPDFLSNVGYHREETLDTISIRSRSSTGVQSMSSRFENLSR